MAFFKTEIHHPTCQGVIKCNLVSEKDGLYSFAEAFNYVVYYYGNKYEFELPVGYLTNFASVPKWAWRFFHPVENGMLVASCIHDYVVNEFYKKQPTLSRQIKINDRTANVDTEIDGFLAADLFFAVLYQEGSYNMIVRQFLRGCVKGYFYSTLKGWV